VALGALGSPAPPAFTSASLLPARPASPYPKYSPNAHEGASGSRFLSLDRELDKAYTTRRTCLPGFAFEPPPSTTARCAYVPSSRFGHVSSLRTSSLYRSLPPLRPSRFPNGSRFPASRPPARLHTTLPSQDVRLLISPTATLVR